MIEKLHDDMASAEKDKNGQIMTKGQQIIKE